ncbi:MAG: hypothetical protein NHF85_00585 [Candidatus Shikimatogenerans sp. JK-2022]|nr:hypothetical protein [Candidatus Shikimatogenerans bostrichidophilus]
MQNLLLYDNDTITAISSPLGKGAISIIRISGNKAFKILKKIFKKKNKKKKKINLGYIKKKEK